MLLWIGRLDLGRISRYVPLCRMGIRTPSTIQPVSTQPVSTQPVSTETQQKRYIDLQDFDGLTALHHAVLGGSFECIQLMLKYGADATIRDANGRTPLDLACETDASSEIIALLS